jgi:hypothetical protein
MEATPETGNFIASDKVRRPVAPAPKQARRSVG